MSILQHDGGDDVAEVGGEVGACWFLPSLGNLMSIPTTLSSSSS